MAACAEPPRPVPGDPWGIGGAGAVVVVTTGGTVVVVVVVAGTVVVVLVVVVAGTVVVVLVVVVAGTVVVVLVVVVVAVDAKHVGVVTTLESKLTCPLRASSRPDTVAPVWAVIEVRAITVPSKDVLVARVAELPTCQKTLQACAPLIKLTELEGAVISVEPA